MTKKTKRPRAYFTTGQIANLFEVSIKTVEAWMAQGCFPFVNTGVLRPYRRIHKDDVISFAKEKGFCRIPKELLDPAKEASVVCFVGDYVREKLVPQECLKWASSWYGLGYLVRDLNPRGVILDGIMGLGEMKATCIALWRLAERPTVIVVLYDDQDPDYLEKCFDVKYKSPQIDPLILAKAVDECRRR